jgi:hypothetical protein
MATGTLTAHAETGPGPTATRAADEASTSLVREFRDLKSRTAIRDGRFTTGPTCGHPIVIGSAAAAGGLGLFVSAELAQSGDDYGVLRARADNVGPWERFQLCENSDDGSYSIRSMENERYVSAELGWSGDTYGMLRARATEIGPWELLVGSEA